MKGWLWVLAGMVSIGGCWPTDDSSLVIATSWSVSDRSELELEYHQTSDDSRPITWIELGPGVRPSEILGRRGGVDLLLGGGLDDFDRMATSGRLEPFEPTDPTPWRVVIRLGSPRREGFAQPTGSRHPERALRFRKVLESRGLIEPSRPDQAIEARLEGLESDLLQAAQVDAREEFREAQAALERSGYPSRLEATLEGRPPWPPASVARLMGRPSSGPLLETLADQLTPDIQARDWLLRSWSGPGRTVDQAMLRELAEALDGRLAREPRFRAWLRGEWTAWTRQLYRRVARVAEGPAGT